MMSGYDTLIRHLTNNSSGLQTTGAYSPITIKNIRAVMTNLAASDFVRLLFGSKKTLIRTFTDGIAKLQTVFTALQSDGSATGAKVMVPRVAVALIVLV